MHLTGAQVKTYRSARSVVNTLRYAAPKYPTTIAARPDGRSAFHARTGCTDRASARPIDAARGMWRRTANTQPGWVRVVCGRLPARVSKPVAPVCLPDAFNHPIESRGRDD